MSDKWVTMSEACQALGRTERTLRRWINEGKIQSKREDKRLFVLVDITDTEADIQTDTNLVEQVRRENELLREQIKEKDQQINQQQAIIMQLSRNQQLMLESSEQKAKRGWWSRVFRKAPDESN